MISQLLGKYLVEKGIIKKDALTKILNEQAATRVKLGTIAVADNYMTEEQAEEVNKLQMQVDKRFGDIAIEKGYITDLQLGTLLSKQGSPYMQFLQLLVENCDISIPKIDSYIFQFQRDYGFSDIEMNALKCDDLDIIVPVFAFASKPHVTDITALVVRNITRFVTTDFYIGHIRKVEDFSFEHMSGQYSLGQNTILLAIASDYDNAFLKIASGFSKSEFEIIDTEVYDVVGEFVNCISGLFASDLSSRNIDVDMDPPFARNEQTALGSAYVIPIFISGIEVDLFIAVDAEITFTGNSIDLNTAKTAGSSKSPNSKGTVVIVDDSRMSRNLLRNLLEEDGFTVVEEAANGIEGIEAYKKFKPDFITLDITMPVMDGIETLQQIKEYDKNANIVMISAAGQQKKIVQSIKLGASKFIAKPFDKDEVLSNINSLFNK